MHRRKLTGMLFVLSVAAMAVSAVRFESAGVHAVRVDVTRPLRIERPMEIKRVGQSAEHALYIAPLSGRGWKNEAGGLAEFAFEVPAEGEYFVWAYCLWRDACTNAVFVRIDEGEKTILGNDPIFGRWHWVRGSPARLAAGAHRIRLSNHSDDIAIRYVVLIDSAAAKPDENALTFAELFHEDFDGCDAGNFGDWEQLSGQWAIYELPGKPGGRKLVIGKTAEGGAMMTVGETDWSGYQLDASVMISADEPATTGGVCFSVKGRDRYHLLRLGVNAQAQRALILEDHRGGEVRQLGVLPVAWEKGRWHQVEIRLLPGRVAVRFDGLRVSEIETPEPCVGAIGLWLKNGEARFDDVHVRSLPAGR